MLVIAWAFVFGLTLINTFALSMRYLGGLGAIFSLPITVSLVVWCAVETFSFLNQLIKDNISFFWIGLLILTYMLALYTGSFKSLSPLWRAAIRTWAGLAFLYKLAIAAVMTIWGLTFFLAVFSPPNNWDSMTYHMPRVMHWIANGNLAPYFTSIDRQIVQPPLSSYLTLQSVILTDTDYLANLINWSAGVWCIAVMCTLAYQLTRSVQISVLTVFFVGTIPIGIAESTTTQNDWLMALWPLLVCLLWVSYRQDKIVNQRVLMLITATLLFAAAATKQQSLLYSTIFMFALATSVAARHNFLRGASLMIVGTIGALAALLPQFIRNFTTFNNPFGPPDLVSLVTGRSFFDPLKQVSSFIGHAFFNVPVPKSVPVESIGDYIFGFFGLSTVEVFAAAGWSKYLPFPGMQIHEDSAANPVGFFLGSLALVWILFNKKHKLLRDYSLVSLILGLSVLLLWEANVGSNRYFLPYFALAAVPIAFYVSKWPLKFSILSVSAVASYGLAFVLVMEYRPMVGSNSVFNVEREKLYFYSRPELMPQFDVYLDAVQEVVTPKSSKQIRVGVIMGKDDYEYPLWIGTQGLKIRVEHLNLTSPTLIMDSRKYDFIFCWGPQPENFSILAQIKRPNVGCFEHHPSLK